MKQDYDLHIVHIAILKKRKKKVYQPHSNNLYQLYKSEILKILGQFYKFYIIKKKT